ncbi:hypothetical protein BDV95DRAFT_609553 [Massariosphaeria phaeospora]|uniref:Amidohydrolase-related domain-containing protein n=1 Tax=Massariosphaeria phaeospora TaxID=100035 RepID=A0A7C8M554_9PLEO|nr:hypothetical protein BDV95DRAFT_609553 [Massariosphaeria phaeospora]
MAAPTLFKNGTVLLHDANNHVVPIRTDILIQVTIVEIAPDIEPDEAWWVVDCTDKIISPGFIDTHHHAWQTQLKGRHANEMLMEYMISGNAQSVQYTPKDVFYGQLSGMLEAVAAGTTTVLDHAHVITSPEHAKQGVAGAVASGVRSIFCYSPISRVKNFNPLTYHANPLEDWVMQTFFELTESGPWERGRVKMGFGYDLYFMPEDVTKGIFADVKAKGIDVITTHFVNTPQLGLGRAETSLVKKLKSMDLLDEHILMSHANGCPKEDIELIKAAGAHVSSTPSSELQMAFGRPVCFNASFLDGGPDGSLAGIQDHASLGIDCHSNNSGSIIGEARLALQNARNHFNEHYYHQGKSTRRLPESLSVEAAFNLATVKGAEAIRMEKEIGKIAVRMKADFAIFDALSPGMVAAAQHDPVAAIILHSSPADIEMVVVDGIIRKRDGKLLPVTGGERKEKKLEWSEIAREVVKSRERIQKEIEKIDMVEGGKAIMKLFHIDESVYVD